MSEDQRMPDPISAFLDPRWGAELVGQGPPDFEHEMMAIWLLTRGPPFALRFARYFPSTKTANYDFYHRHDTVDSIHIITSGTGHYAVEDKEYAMRAGMVVHHARGIPHCGPFADPDGMDMVVIQTPRSGHTSDFIVCPEAGLRGAYGDKAAFVAKYGEGDLSRFGKLGLDGAGKKSPKWLAWHEA